MSGEVARELLPRGAAQGDSEYSSESLGPHKKPLYLDILEDKLLRPSFRAIFDIVSQTPHLRQQLSSVRAHKKEFLNSSIDPDTLHDVESAPYRRVMMLLAALSVAASDKSIAPLLEHAIDYEACRESEALKQILFTPQEAQHHVPVVVVGAGVHAAAFNCAYAHSNPSDLPITFDRRSILGGQFRSYNGPVIRLNSPSAPIHRDRKGRHDIADFNIVGEMAPFRVSHITSALYPTNADLGLIIALNQYLCGRTVLGVEVVGCRLGDVGEHRIVTIRDVDSGATAEISTQRASLLTGLGRDKIGFRDPDDETLSALKENAGRISEERFYYTYQELLELFGGKHPSRLQALFGGKHIIIQGGGHSALTVIELLTGLGPNEERHLSQTGGAPACITIIGASHATAEEFQSNEFSRYVEVAALFPRNAHDKDSLIQPVVGTYAYQLRKHQKWISVECGPKGAKPTFSVMGDVLISTVGFAPEAETILGHSPEVCAAIKCEGTEGLEHLGAAISCAHNTMDHHALHALSLSGCTYTCENGERYCLCHSEDGSSWICYECDANGVIDENSAQIVSHDKALAILLKERRPVHITYPAWQKESHRLPPILDANGKILGRYGLCEQIVIAGPAAAPMLQEDDRKRIETLGSPGNAVSISVTVDDTCALATEIAKSTGERVASFEAPERYSNMLTVPPTLKNCTQSKEADLLRFGLLRVARSVPNRTLDEKLSITFSRKKGGGYSCRSSRPLTSDELAHLDLILADPAISKLLSREIDQITFPWGKQALLDSMRAVRV